MAIVGVVSPGAMGSAMANALTAVVHAWSRLVANIERRLASAASKSGRLVAEMHQIAASQSAVGLTPNLFEAMAEIYATLAKTSAAAKDPEEITAGESLEQVLEGMREL